MVLTPLSSDDLFWLCLGVLLEVRDRVLGECSNRVQGELRTRVWVVQGMSGLGMKYTFFFIRTPNFLPRLDVLIFLAISASNVLIDVLKYLTIKIRYSYSTTVYLQLNTIVFSLKFKIK